MEAEKLLKAQEKLFTKLSNIFSKSLKKSLYEFRNFKKLDPTFESHFFKLTCEPFQYQVF